MKSQIQLDTRANHRQLITLQLTNSLTVTLITTPEQPISLNTTLRFPRQSAEQKTKQVLTNTETQSDLDTLSPVENQFGTNVSLVPIDETIDYTEIEKDSHKDSQKDLGLNQKPNMQKDLWDGQETFMLQNKLGEGGMGIVYTALQSSLCREVAVKQIKQFPHIQTSELIKEARLMAKLNHPNIPPVYCLSYTENDHPQVVMKKIEGETLQSWLEISPKSHSNIKKALKVLIQICYAVEFAHDKGIIHRDIKAENIMLGQFNEVYLMDWGLALDVNQLNQARYGLVGTPSYMAPEMLHGDPSLIGPFTDVYLLGALLHHLIIRETRHTGQNIEDCLKMVYESQPFNDSNPSSEYSIPIPLIQICNQACHVDPKQRYVTVSLLRKELAHFLETWDIVLIHEQGKEYISKYKQLLASPDVHEKSLWEASYQAKSAFEQVLSLSPHFTEAKQERDRLLYLMITQAISRKELQLARSLVRELSHDSQKLAFELDINQLIEKEDEKLSKLKELEYDLDPVLTQQPRLLLIKILGTSAVFTIISGYFWLRADQFVIQAKHGFIFGVSGTIPTLVSIYFLRNKLLVNELGKQATRLVGMLAMSLLMSRFFIWQVTDNIKMMMTLDALIIGLGFSFNHTAIKHGTALSTLGFLTSILLYVAPTSYGDLILNFYILTIVFSLYHSWAKS